MNQSFLCDWRGCDSVRLQDSDHSSFSSFGSIAIKFAGKSLRKLFERKYREETIVDLMESLSKGLMWFLAALITLSNLGFSQIAAAMEKLQDL